MPPPSPPPPRSLVAPSVGRQRTPAHPPSCAEQPAEQPPHDSLHPAAGGNGRGASAGQPRSAASLSTIDGSSATAHSSALTRLRALRCACGLCEPQQSAGVVATLSSFELRLRGDSLPERGEAEDDVGSAARRLDGTVSASTSSCVSCATPAASSAASSTSRAAATSAGSFSGSSTPRCAASSRSCDVVSAETLRVRGVVGELVGELDLAEAMDACADESIGSLEVLPIAADRTEASDDGHCATATALRLFAAACRC